MEGVRSPGSREPFPESVSSSPLWCAFPSGELLKWKLESDIVGEILKSEGGLLGAAFSIIGWDGLMKLDVVTDNADVSFPDAKVLMFRI